MSAYQNLTRLLRGPLTKRRPESIVRVVPAVLYMFTIHALSSVEGGDLPALIDDRLAHFIEYFGFSILLHLAFSGFDNVGRPWAVCLSVVLFAAAYGAIDEWHQSFVPGRDSSMKDIGFDIAGATTGALLVRWLAWRGVKR